MARPIMPPVDFSSVQLYGDAEELAAYHEQPRRGLRYARDGSSTSMAVEAALAAFEPGYTPLVFSSGMAAITALLDVLRDRGKIWLPVEKYRKLERLKLHYEFAEYYSIDSVPHEGVLWVEAPSNPHLSTVDYGLLERKAKDMTVVGDLSFAGVGNVRRPEALFDFMVHSGTKYLAGHNDVVCGAVYAREEEDAHALWERRSYGGGLLDPMSCYLLYRSLKTYNLRIKKQTLSAATVENYLRVKTVPYFYPDRGRNADRPTGFWERHRHGGAVISFLSNHPAEKLTDIVAGLGTAAMGASFGGVDSLAEVPATMSKTHVEPNLVRYSVGIEPIGDILEDIGRLIG